MLVRDCMTTPPVTIQPHVSLREALERMHELRRLPVVDDQDRLVGIVSERDLLYASPPPAGLLDGVELEELLSELPVAEIMTRDVITTTPATFVEEAARLMADNKIGGLPVVDENNRVLGVITETDLFKAFIEIYRAGHAGLYLSLRLRQRPGLMADLSKAILGLGDDIVAITSSYDDQAGEYRLVVKGQDIDKDRVVHLLESLGNHVTEAYEL
ncbi:MAG: CBS domain-containing protein [Anaerolineae bacterium]